MEKEPEHIPKDILPMIIVLWIVVTILYLYFLIWPVDLSQQTFLSGLGSIFQNIFVVIGLGLMLITSWPILIYEVFYNLKKENASKIC